jgi:hypothetical protein
MVMVLWYAVLAVLKIITLILTILGALHQYHTALLLLSELYATDVRYHEDRIWKCLDYVFELTPDVPRREKARVVLSEIIHKTEIYHSLRRVRAPKEIEESMGGPPNTAISNMRMQTSPVMSNETPTPPPPGVGGLQGSAEYRVYNPTIADHVYYAPPHVDPHPPSQSPQSSDATDQMRTEGSFASSNSPKENMLDIDWVSH